MAYLFKGKLNLLAHIYKNSIFIYLVSHVRYSSMALDIFGKDFTIRYSSVSSHIIFNISVVKKPRVAGTHPVTVNLPKH